MTARASNSADVAAVILVLFLLASCCWSYHRDATVAVVAVVSTNTKRQQSSSRCRDSMQAMTQLQLGCMQVGDQLDRGDNEIQILYFLERLQQEATAAGGALHILNGNHETMNVGGRFRYATAQGRVDFIRWQIAQKLAATMKVLQSNLSKQPIKAT